MLSYGDKHGTKNKKVSIFGSDTLMSKEVKENLPFLDAPVYEITCTKINIPWEDGTDL
jgi:hypothetical protein